MCTIFLEGNVSNVEKEMTDVYVPYSTVMGHDTEITVGAGYGLLFEKWI